MSSVARRLRSAGRVPIPVSGTLSGSGTLTIQPGAGVVTLVGRGGSGYNNYWYDPGQPYVAAVYHPEVQYQAAYWEPEQPYIAPSGWVPEQPYIAPSGWVDPVPAQPYVYAWDGGHYWYGVTDGTTYGINNLYNVYNHDTPSGTCSSGATYTTADHGAPYWTGSYYQFDAWRYNAYTVSGNDYQAGYYSNPGQPYQAGYYSNPGQPYQAAVYHPEVQYQAAYTTPEQPYRAPSSGGGPQYGTATTATLNGSTASWAGGYDSGGAGVSNTQTITSNGAGQTLTYSVGSGGTLSYSYEY